MTGEIYLDYNATTPVDPSVLESMLPWFSNRFFNPASAHRSGRSASAAIDDSRQQVARAIGGSPGEVVFTSGATEANNLALKGIADELPLNRRRVLVGATEHLAVLDVAEWLETRGVRVDSVPVDAHGSIDVKRYEALLDSDVGLVAIMVANNETGVIAPVAPLAELAHQAGALFHTDATQALGRMSVDVRKWGVDTASFSAHKIYGPKGSGALYVKRGTELGPLLHGGGHEKGLRSGTLNVPAIVGFGLSAELAASSWMDDSDRYSSLSRQLLDGMTSMIPHAELIGREENRLSNTTTLRFVGAEADAVMANVPDVAVSSGSACSSLVPSASHVLRAMGLSENAAFECIRFSVGRPTNSREVNDAVDKVASAVKRVREIATLESGFSQ
jgi:cysteine desulfurase